jgi:hypothetical protein
LALLDAAERDPNANLRLEGGDDLEITTDGPQRFVQVKHSISDEPELLTERSRDLWRTLGVWSDLVRTSTMTGDERFLLVTTKTCKAESTLVSLRFPGTSKIDEVLQTLNNLAASNEPASNRKDYAAWRALTDANRRLLLRSASIADGSLSLSEVENGLTNRLRLLNRNKKKLSFLVNAVLGWWMNRAATNLMDSGDRIEATELDEKIHELAASLADENLPILVTPDFDDELAAQHQRLFVRQLELIRKGQAATLLAIKDYLQAEFLISQWLREDLILITRLEQYLSELTGEWEFWFAEMQGKVSEATPAELEALGAELYARIMDKQKFLTPNRREGFLMRGSYHRLADQLDVGWHPEYKKRLP